MQEHPKMVSPSLISLIRINKFHINQINPFVEYLIPNNVLSCEAIMIRDVPDVNADVTGIEIKSTTNPLILKKN
jgi:hypothetical protein